MDDLHDWSTHLLVVEKELRRLNDKLLHKEYAGTEEHIQTIKYRLDKTLAWIKENRE